jgi:ribonuclease HI
MNTIQVWFDGGYDGAGYGSWEAQYCGLTKRVSREKYEDSFMTNNVAEYLALLQALYWLRLNRIQDMKRYSLEIWGDSMLVVQQVNQRWRTRKPHLQRLKERVLAQLKDWGGFTITWHRRNNNVARFGH